MVLSLWRELGSCRVTFPVQTSRAVIEFCDEVLALVLPPGVREEV